MNDIPDGFVSIADGGRPFTDLAKRVLAGSGDAQRHAGNRAAPEPAPVAPLTIICPIELAGRPIPERHWLVRDWIPSGVVTGLYGNGGLGKSLIAQQLQSAAALGSAWLGLPVNPTPSLGIYCEDSADELHRRQENINISHNCDFRDLADVHWTARLGEDNLLMTFARNGAGELTAFYRQTLEAALDLHARLVIVDTAADVFGGDENNRGQVRQFVSRGLGSIAQAIGGAVLLCAHPSRSGLSSGEGDGGSTGWSNSLRSRLFLSEAVVEGDGLPDPDVRVLARKKANYAARGDELRLRWRNGVIVPDQPLQASSGAFGRRAAEDVFLALLDDFAAACRPVSASPNAGNFAPKAFFQLPPQQREGYTKADFRRAMESLFASRSIKLVDYGRMSDRRQKIVRGEP